MKKSLTGILTRVDRLASSVEAGCDNCRDVTPERVVCCVESLEGDRMEGDVPQVEECGTCGRAIPIRPVVVWLSPADAAI